MRVFRSPGEVPAGFGPSVVTIGNFDGVHVGHRAIMRRVVEIARRTQSVPTVLTFDPHPARILVPERAPKLIMTINQRLRRFEAEGIEAVLLLPFSLEFAKQTPEGFALEILDRTLKAKCVLVGEDFRFGHKQSGNVETLRELGEQFGFALQIVKEIKGRGERVSSSAIRKLVSEGKVSKACRMMGAPFALEGPVVRGQGIGSKQTVPTLNLAPENELLPKPGVYVTRTNEWKSITNVGYRPTFGGHGLTVESFLLDSFSGTTPERIEVSLLAWVREERKFETPELLKAQILRDVRSAIAFHRRTGAFVNLNQ